MVATRKFNSLPRLTGQIGPRHGAVRIRKLNLLPRQADQYGHEWVIFLPRHTDPFIDIYHVIRGKSEFRYHHARGRARHGVR